MARSLIDKCSFSVGEAEGCVTAHPRVRRRLGQIGLRIIQLEVRTHEADISTVAYHKFSPQPIVSLCGFQRPLGPVGFRRDFRSFLSQGPDFGHLWDAQRPYFRHRCVLDCCLAFTSAHWNPPSHVRLQFRLWQGKFHVEECFPGSSFRYSYLLTIHWTLKVQVHSFSASRGIVTT